MLSLPISEASAKVRTGPPLDEEDDYNLPVWAGVLPLKLVPSEPVADPRLAPTSRRRFTSVDIRGPDPCREAGRRLRRFEEKGSSSVFDRQCLVDIIHQDLDGCSIRLDPCVLIPRPHLLGCIRQMDSRSVHR